MVTTADPPTLGQRLRELRDRLKMSQAELSQRSGVSLSLVEKLEQGQTADPKASTIVKLARALGVTANDLIWPVGEG